MKTRITLSKFLSMFLVAVLLVSSLVPYPASAQERQSLVSLESVVEIPQVTVDAEVYQDLSGIDWTQQVNIDGKKVSLNSEESLNVLDISQDIKRILRSYRSENASVDKTILMWPWTKNEKKERLEEGLRFSVAKKLIENGDLPENYFELSAYNLVEPGNNIIDLSQAVIADPSKIISVEKDIEIGEAKIVEPDTKPLSFLERIGDLVKGTVGKLVAWLSPDRALADVATVTDATITYLIGQQNGDGSWGAATSTRYMTTVAVLNAFHAHDITGTSTDKGIEWLDSYVADNNDYIADQVRIFANAGAATSTEFVLPALIRGAHIDQGGFIFRAGYAPDPVTTAKAIRAMHAVDYEDEGLYPDLTVSGAINYLIDTQRFDNGWNIAGIGPSSLPITTEVIEALLLWKNRTMGGHTEVNDTLHPALSSLISTQMSNGTWGNDLLNTALAYHAIKAAGQIPTYQLATVEYFEDEQEGNGSFADDIYITAKVLEALSVATNSGQLVVSDLIPQVTLRTGDTTEIDIRISNPGNIAVDTGKLHIIADGVIFGTFDFEDWSIVVNASSTIDLPLIINSTRDLLEDVEFKVFIEGTNNVIHPQSEYEETLNFLTASDNRPAIPMWYSAYKSTSSGGAAAVTFRWPIKQDPKLHSIALMIRPQGDPSWQILQVTSTTTTSSVTVTGFANNGTYEVSVGTVSPLGQIYYYSGSGVTTVKTHQSPSVYTDGTIAGKVVALEGPVSLGVGIVGPTASTTTFAEEDGTYLQEDAPWGRGFARVSNFLFESYRTEYEVWDDNLTDVTVYTKRHADTANPSVTSLLIVGESDYEMENLEKKIIQYTVDDDIKVGSDGVVQSASFYYYNPHTSTWNLIGTESGVLYGTLTYEWDIPGSLVGEDFKIRVIVRDWAGKDSSPVEWGPFESHQVTPLRPLHSLLRRQEYRRMPIQATPSNGLTVTLMTMQP